MRFKFPRDLISLDEYDKRAVEIGTPTAPMHQMLSRDVGKLLSLAKHLPKNQGYFQDKVKEILKKLRIALENYHKTPKGQANFLGPRLGFLKEIMELTDKMSEAIIFYENLKTNTQFNSQKLAKLILEIQDQAGQIIQYITYVQEYLNPKNLLRRVLNMSSGLTAKGQKLQSVTGGHYREVLDPMHGRYDGELDSLRDVYESSCVRLRKKNTKEKKKNPDEGVEPFILWCETQFLQGDDQLSNFTGINYMTKSERQAVSVEFRGGLFNRWSNSNGLELAPISMEAAFSIDQAGVVYVLPHRYGETHHSTATAGEAVICAGMLKLDDGKLTFLNNKTGHYAATPYMFLQALRLFDSRFALQPETVAHYDFFDNNVLKINALALLRAYLAGFPKSFRVQCKVSDDIYNKFVAAAKDNSYQSEYYNRLEGEGENQMEEYTALIYKKGLTRKRGQVILPGQQEAPKSTPNTPGRRRGKAVIYK